MKKWFLAKPTGMEGLDMPARVARPKPKPAPVLSQTKPDPGQKRNACSEGTRRRSNTKLFLPPRPPRTEGRWNSLDGRSQRGFSLLEILVVLSIAGILFGLSRSTLGALAPKFDLDNATRMTIAAINRAQVRAITRGSNTTLDFGTGSHSFSIADPSGAVAVTDNLPGTITAYSSLVTFTPLGTIQNAYGWVYLYNGSDGQWVWVLRSGEIVL